MALKCSGRDWLDPQLQFTFPLYVASLHGLNKIVLKAIDSNDARLISFLIPGCLTYARIVGEMQRHIEC